MTTDALHQAHTALKAEYDAACAERDAVNAANAPLEAELERANTQIEALRGQAAELAARIDDARGRERWLELKKRIGRLAEGLMALRK